MKAQPTHGPTAFELPALLISTTRPSLPAIRALGTRGVPLWVATQEHGIGSSSRHIRGFFSMPSPLTAPEEFLARLQEIRLYFEVSPVLIPCDDLTVGVLAHGAELLSSCYRLLGPSPAVAFAVLDKGIQYARAAEAGVPLPRTWSPRSAADARRIGVEARFPVIVKPGTAQQFLVTHGFKAVQVETAVELEALLDSFTGMIVQEAIPGDVECIYEHNSFIDREGRVVVSSVTRKRDEDPKPLGSATAIELVNAPEVEELGLRAVRAFDFRGVSHSEFKYDERDGTYKFIELNPRFAWSAAVQVAAGVDTIYPAYAEAAGLPFGAGVPRSNRTLWLTPERLTKGKAFVPPPPVGDSLPGPTRLVTDMFDASDARDLGPLWMELRNAALRRAAKLWQRLPSFIRAECLSRAQLSRREHVARALRFIGNFPGQFAARRYLQKGRSRHGQPLQVLLAGGSDSMRSIVDRLFEGGEGATERSLGWRSLRATAGSDQADLVIVFAPEEGLSGTGWRGWRMLRAHTRHSLSLSLGAEELLGRMEELGCAVGGRLLGASHDVATIDAGAAWHEFYQKMYRPCRPEGKRREPANASWLRRLAAGRGSQIHFAFDGDTRVAGVLTHVRGPELHVLASGVLHGSARLRESGALGAALRRAIEWGREQGAQLLVWDTTPHSWITSDIPCTSTMIAFHASTPAGLEALADLQEDSRHPAAVYQAPVQDVRLASEPQRV